MLLDLSMCFDVILVLNFIGINCHNYKNISLASFKNGGNLGLILLNFTPPCFLFQLQQGILKSRLLKYL